MDPPYRPAELKNEHRLTFKERRTELTLGIAYNWQHLLFVLDHRSLRRLPCDRGEHIKEITKDISAHSRFSRLSPDLSYPSPPPRRGVETIRQ
jgi:hypothetical protein